MRAMIFAAGLGTRLKPITDKMPKALVEVGGKTLLERQIDELKAAGFNEIVINIHHFAQMIRDYLAANDNFGVDIYLSDESDELKDTGGGIKQASSLLDDGEPFLVHNVDILSNLDLNDLYDYHLSHAISNDTPLATIVVSPRKTTRYFLFDRDGNLVGWMNEQTGEVKTPFKELAKSAMNYMKRPENGNGVCEFDVDKFLSSTNLSKYAFAGMHVMGPYVITLMQGWPNKFSIVDFYLQNCDKFNIRAYVKNDLKLVDVGKLSTLHEAEEFVK